MKNETALTKEKFISRLTYLMKKNSLSYNDLAAGLGVAPITVRKWLELQAKDNIPSVFTSKHSTFADIANYFNDNYSENITAKWLMGIDDYTNDKAKTTCKYTGLTENGIESIQNLRDDEMLPTLETLLKSKQFLQMILLVKQVYTNLDDIENSEEYTNDQNGIYKRKLDKDKASGQGKYALSIEFENLKSSLFPLDK